VVSAGTQRPLHLPQGDWIDYWTGAKLRGPLDTVISVPLDRIPLFVKPGTILPKIPEDVMTLVPRTGTASSSIPTLDDRRVYEIYPGPPRAIQDFEGRRLEVRTDSGGSTLQLSGPAARVTIIWRSAPPHEVSWNGTPLALQAAGDSGSVTFAHTADSRLVWR
jgi:alpha-D-xyloside xylohydrolase